MRDVLPELRRWWESGEAVGVGTVVGTYRSAPRPAGAAMLVGPDGTAVGSVSGGCVEGAVYELATEVRGGSDPVLQRYGVSDDDAFAVGLTCGGIIDIFTEQISRSTFPEFDEYARRVPRLLPRLTPARFEDQTPSPAASSTGQRQFSPVRYSHHREYNASMGAAAIYAVLLLRLWLLH